MTGSLIAIVFIIGLLNLATFSEVNRFGRYTLAPVASPLPVELISFTAIKKGADAVLNWAVAKEENNSGFEVQASTDGYTFQKIGFVKSQVGTSSSKQQYSFTDARPSKQGTIYYRLKQIDLDGKSTIYGPKDISFGAIAGTSLTAYPNPFSADFRAVVITAQQAPAILKLYDGIGQQLIVKEVQLHAGENTLEISTGSQLPAGMYILAVEIEGQVHKMKLIKQ